MSPWSYPGCLYLMYCFVFFFVLFSRLLFYIPSSLIYHFPFLKSKFFYIRWTRDKFFSEFFYDQKFPFFVGFCRLRLFSPTSIALSLPSLFIFITSLLSTNLFFLNQLYWLLCWDQLLLFWCFPGVFFIFLYIIVYLENFILVYMSICPKWDRMFY